MRGILSLLALSKNKLLAGFWSLFRLREEAMSVQRRDSYYRCQAVVHVGAFLASSSHLGALQHNERHEM